MTDQERLAMKAASDSKAFNEKFAGDVARYAKEWVPSSATNAMPWNANDLPSVGAAYLSDAAQDERATLHDYAVSLIASFGLSGERGLAAYNAVADAYASYIKKGAAAVPDLDPSSVLSFDEFYAHVVSKV